MIKLRKQWNGYKDVRSFLIKESPMWSLILIVELDLFDESNTVTLKLSYFV